FAPYQAELPKQVPAEQERQASITLPLDPEQLPEQRQAFGFPTPSHEADRQRTAHVNPVIAVRLLNRRVVEVRAEQRRGPQVVAALHRNHPSGDQEDRSIIDVSREAL